MCDHDGLDWEDIALGRGIWLRRWPRRRRNVNESGRRWRRSRKSTRKMTIPDVSSRQLTRLDRPL